MTRTQRARRLALPALLALAATCLTVPATAAVSVDHWVYDARPVGMPATDVAARQLVSADALHRIAWDGHLDVTVELGAAPTGPDSDADLHVVFGKELAGEECVPSYEFVTTTFSTPAGVSRDGATLTISRALGHYQGDQWICGSVFLTAPGDPVVTDRLDGRLDSTAHIDYLARVNIADVGHTRLPRGEWSYVRVRLKNVGHDVQRVRVRGHGRGLEVGKAVMTGSFATGTTYTLDVPVMLEARRARRLTLSTYPRGHDIAFTFVDEKRVTIRPRR